jgi:hypothetical protein
VSRDKNDPVRGRPIQLPEWWLEAVRRRCADWTKDEIAEKLNEAAHPPRPFKRSAVSDFLLGKVTTVELMGAFLALFPTLPAPVLWAASYEEADQLRHVAQMYRHQANVPVLAKTAEDYDAEPHQDSTAEGKKKRATRSNARSAK